MKLTVGTVVYDDYDGLYFSLQALRMYHPVVLQHLEFVIVDNNPTSEHGKAVSRLMAWIKQPVQYVPFSEYKSTAVRNIIFQRAKTDYVICLDCHVLFVQGALMKLLEYFRGGHDQGNLLQGPLLYDDLQNVATHFTPVWRESMYGIWATDERGRLPGAEPFEIPMQGLGVFACRRDAWLGFNQNFRGFGGEEGYIHEKYRRAGKKTVCLPFLRWLHRFGRPGGVPYPLRIDDRIRNYYIGRLELGMNVDEVTEHFSKQMKVEDLTRLLGEARQLLGA